MLGLAGSDPAGGADTLSYSIDWGDGSPVQALSAAQLAALGGNVDHVFADDEDGLANATDRTITVTVSDEDGGSSITTKTVTVNNVAPVAAVSGAATVAEAASYTLSVGAVVDPGTDSVSGYSIDWGDGSVDSFTPSQWAAAAGSFGHVYGDGGLGGTPFLITVRATDEDGEHVLGTRAVTVAPASVVSVPDCRFTVLPATTWVLRCTVSWPLALPRAVLALALSVMPVELPKLMPTPMLPPVLLLLASRWAVSWLEVSLRSPSALRWALFPALISLPRTVRLLAAPAPVAVMCTSPPAATLLPRPVWAVWVLLLWLF